MKPSTKLITLSASVSPLQNGNKIPNAAVKIKTNITSAEFLPPGRCTPAQGNSPLQPHCGVDMGCGFVSSIQMRRWDSERRCALPRIPGSFQLLTNSSLRVLSKCTYDPSLHLLQEDRGPGSSGDQVRRGGMWRKEWNPAPPQG